MIAVVNRSTRMANVDAQVATYAVYHQLRYHAAPAWGYTTRPVVFYADESQVPAGAWKVVLLDNADQANALGYHGVDPSGNPYARVFVGTTLDNGGSALHTPMSVAAVLSHEVLEAFCDPFVGAWEDNGRGTLYAKEVGDPVENDSYLVSDDHGNTAYLSNFVYPAWFNPWAGSGARFDYMKTVHAPFAMSPHGYVITMADGQVKQTFGDDYPEWKRETKDHAGSRTARRLDFEQVPFAVNMKAEDD